MIRNPILPGFNPDPSIVRVGDDYYIATSTFEWYPGRADPSFARSRELAPAHAAAAPRQPAQHARRSGLVRRLGAVPHLQRRALLADLHRRQALRPHDGRRRLGRVAARLPQLPGDLPDHRRRLVGSRVPEQQRLRSFAVPRRRRAQVPGEHALGPSPGPQPLRRHRAAGVFAGAAQADRRAPATSSRARRLASPKRRTSTSATATTI